MYMVIRDSNNEFRLNALSDAAKRLAQQGKRVAYILGASVRNAELRMDLEMHTEREHLSAINMVQRLDVDAIIIDGVATDVEENAYLHDPRGYNYVIGRI